ncbi:MAG: OmpA family protein [Bacteroidia bacterium]|nr:OmpA family protein [Bacteroidia bacterium]
MLKHLLLLIILFPAIACKAQPPGEYSTSDKKALKLYQDARKAYNEQRLSDAESGLRKAVERVPEFIEAWTMLGYVYAEQKKTDLSIEALTTAVQLNPGFRYGENVFTLARLQMSVGKYGDAKKNYEKYRQMPKQNPKFAPYVEMDIQCCEFAIGAMQHPVPFKPVNMGPEINTKDYEYFPTVTADDQLFLFTRNIRTVKEDNSTHMQEDFFYSKKENGKWTPSVSVGNNINTPTMNEGAPNLSSDGNILFFVVCPDMMGYGENRKGFGSCDIFFSMKNGEKWVKAQNAGSPLNSGHWESQPSFSSDGRTMYFTKGIKGEYERQDDIYMCTLDENGKWSAPQKLGPNVNTPGTEESVFIHPDNQTLYFSSDGRVGMGGMDIYMCRRQPDGNWGPAVNLGYPINTCADENSLLVGGSGEIAYFASDREGGYGGLDLYFFELDKSLQPEKISYMKGKVYDKKTGKPLDAAFELIDLETGLPVVRSNSNPGNGQFLITLPPNKNYALNVSKDGYNFYSENFSFKESPADKPFLVDVPLVKPEDASGEIVELKNVFFETAKWDLKPTSKYELDKLAEFLQKHNTVKIELRGHTDNVGDDKSNLILSDNRAKAVYQYLVSKGIDKSRLSWKGFGETLPKTTNDTPEGRAQNRRTEYRIL